MVSIWIVRLVFHCSKQGVIVEIRTNYFCFIGSSNVSETPTVGGYGFVSATPSPNPSQVDSSELMTWGMIEGTPLLIGGDQTPGM